MANSQSSASHLQISVIIPVYNRERYIKQALDSVLAQTYANFEVIAIDDGSSDSSLAILNEYQRLHPDKIRVLVQKNAGPSVARNNGIMAARGEYIAFLDSDDYWAANKLEKQLALFEKHSNVAFVYSGYSLIDEMGNVFEERRPEPDFQGNIHDKLWLEANIISGGTLLVQREKLMRIGLFDIDLRGAENLDLRLRLSAHGDVYFAEDLLYFYRIHRESLTANLENMDKFNLVLLDKHFGPGGVINKKMWSMVRSNHLYYQGGLFLQKGECRKAAKDLFGSLLLKPTRPRAYINLLRCFLGGKFNRWLVSLKNK